jgi:hypothetical protein
MTRNLPERCKKKRINVERNNFVKMRNWLENCKGLLNLLLIMPMGLRFIHLSKGIDHLSIYLLVSLYLLRILIILMDRQGIREGLLKVTHHQTLKATLKATL